MSWLSSLLGLDAQHNANQQSTQAQNQAAEASSYRGQANAGYNAIQEQGNTQLSTYNNNYLNLLGQFANSAGVNFNPGNASGQRLPGQSGTPAGADPYQLDQNQSQLLNQQNAAIQAQKQQALGSYQQELASRGITDPRAIQAGQQQLEEHFADLQSRQQAQFYEQIRSQKEQALQALIQQIQQSGATGLQELEYAASGKANLGGAALSAQQSSIQNSQFQQQLANQQFGGLLNLVGFGLGGGFNSPASAGTGGNASTETLLGYGNGYFGG